MDSRCLSTGSLRFLGLLCPLRDSALLTVGLLAAGEDDAPCARPHRGCHVPLLCDATGVGVLFAPGSWCPGCTPDQGRHPLVCAKSRAQTLDPSPPSLSANLRRSRITKRQQGFTRVHPSSLSLACGSPLGLVRSWAFPSLLHTPPLPATHGEVGTGIGHLPESSLSFCSTHEKRPRVAPIFSVSPIDPR